MTDLKVKLENFSDIKDIKDLLDDLDKLRVFYYNRNFDQMQWHIHELTQKYFVETKIWNTVNHNFPIQNDYQQQFINAENFLFAQGFKKLNELHKDWRKALTKEEVQFIESLIKPME